MAFDRTEEIAESKTLKMTDEGTRYQHLTELLNEWETGLDIIRKRIPKGVQPIANADRAVKLYWAIDFLKTHIDFRSGFHDSVNQYKLRKSIVEASKEQVEGRG